MDLNSFEDKRYQRNLMCESVYKALNIQDVTSDVILSRASTVISLLVDVTQLSQFGLLNCTWVLLETIYQYPEVIGRIFSMDYLV